MRNTQSLLLPSLLVLVVIVTVAAALFKQNELNSEVSIEAEYEDKIVYTSNPELDEKEELESDCLQRGGEFNACGSPCASDAEACIEVCAYTCEFNEDESNDPEEAQWESYENAELGFAIEYPRSIEPRIETENRIEFMLEGPEQTEATELFDGVRILISKLEYDNSSQTLKGFSEELAGEKSVELADQYAFATYYFETNDQAEYTHFIAPISPGSLFQISAFSSSMEYEGILERMLESFVITEEAHQSVSIENTLQLNEPKLMQSVTSPLEISGRAIGPWFFEGSFNAVLTNWDGRIIGETLLEAEEAWTTEEFVPFSGEIVFLEEDTQPYSRLFLVLQKSNPSGLPENDEALEIPLYLEQ